MSTKQEIAEGGEFIRATVGSKLHGLNVPGQDDTDEMGLCIEPPETVIGLDKFEHWIYRTAGEGQRSQAHDIDLTIYSLRKWCRLALSGNPSILLMLFVTKEQCSKWDWPATSLKFLQASLVAKSVGNAYLGYLKQQRLRLEGIRGGRRKPNRPELVKAHGFDTKYAMHILRLGFQGVELLKTGNITLPMPEEERAFCFAARQGEVSFEDVIQKATDLERDIFYYRDCGELPDKPNKAAVNDWLVNVYRRDWETKRRVGSE